MQYIAYIDLNNMLQKQPTNQYQFQNQANKNLLRKSSPVVSKDTIYLCQ